MIKPVNFQNFFYNAHSKYPAAFSVWEKWLHDFHYKIDWNDVFGENMWFGDLPGCIQAGILIQFMKDRNDMPWRISLEQLNLVKAFDLVFQTIQLADNNQSRRC